MTAGPDAIASVVVPAPGRGGATTDHRGSWVPAPAMVTTRCMELRKRRGLMVTLTLVTVGIPTVFLGVRLLLHAVAPKTYGPAGGYDIYTAMVAGVLYIFGFIVAATLGVTAGSADLTEGMFRHLVVTGRSRLALYLARVPAGLAIIVPLVAAGFAVVCVVCSFAAPTQLTYDGVNLPANLSRAGLQSWAADHADEVICNFNFENGSVQVATVVNSVPCGNGPGGPGGIGPGGGGAVVRQPAGAPAQPLPSQADVRNAAAVIAGMDYADYARHFLSPPVSLMVESGLWLELEAVIGFVVGLGLGSLTGQRTVSVIVMIVLEVVLTPILSRARIAHFSNVQRAVVGLATAHLAPGGLPVLGGGGGGPGGGAGNPRLLPESTTVAVCVVVAWLVGWSVLGAWRMMTRDA